MSDSRRLLIVGLSTSWGGRLAQQLERDPRVEALVGIDEREPRHALEATEFVRTAVEPQALSRILSAAAIDTVIDTRLLADAPPGGLRRARRVNVEGTRRLLAACAEAGSVRKLIFRSSDRWYGSSSSHPAFLVEERDFGRSRPPSDEAGVIAAELAVADLARRRPELTVTVLRFATPIGGQQRGGLLRLLGLPVVPAILGFDPRWQFVHEDDGVAALAHAARRALPGVYNVAGDGVLVLSEIAGLLGKPLAPLPPPFGLSAAARQLRRLGVALPVQLLDELRHGRGLDNRRLKASGFHYRYTSREAVLELAARQRLRPLLGGGGEEYRYERELEEFLRRSPSVRHAPASAHDQPDAEARTPYDSLSEAELLQLIPSLEDHALALLHAHESAHRRRPRLLALLSEQLRARTHATTEQPAQR